MILAIDIGNTNTVIGCIVDDDIPHVIRISTNSAKTADEYASDIRNILNFRQVDPISIDGAIMSCVVPPLTRVLKNAIKQLIGADAVVVGAGVKTGLDIRIDDPAQLGGDMVASAVGALASYTAPLIVVDMGTATKMIVLNNNGSFIGGAILPGVTLSMNALSAGTSQLPRVPIEAPARCISTNTVDCMRSGAVFGAAAMIDGMVERFEEELGEQTHIIITGGMADSIFRYCKRRVVHDPHLILRGLGVIYNKNKR